MYIHSAPTQHELLSCSTQTLYILKQQALQNADQYPFGSLRQRYYLGIARRISAILDQRCTHTFPQISLDP